MGEFSFAPPSAPSPKRREKGAAAPHLVAELEAQLARLARWENPENNSPTAKVYREMLGR